MKYHFLMECGKDFVTFIGRDYTYRDVNTAYLKAQNKKKEEILGRSVSEVWGGEVFQAIVKIHLDQCFSGNEVRDEAWFQFPGLGYRCFDVTYFPCRDEQGEVVFAMVVSCDTTDQKNLEEQFLQAQKMEIMGRLTASVAHDFNNVLTVISGYSEMTLRKKDIDARTQRDIEQILAAAKRGEHLAEQLLTFSRRQQPKPRVVDLNEVLVNMEKMLKRLVGETISLVLVPSPKPAYVKADPGQLEQVIMNLAANARDAMPKGGELTFGIELADASANLLKEYPTAKPGDYILLKAADTGTGMPEEIKKRIFEPFFTTKGKGKGTGLGLATVFGVVEHAGGFMDVDSAVGKGTTFRIYLPKTEEAPSQPVAEKEMKTLPFGTETVLLVEGEPSVRALSLRILCEQGYKVLEASGANEALQLEKSRRSEPIHLLITELSISGMDGRVLAENLRKIRPDLKVLLTSGSIEENQIQESAAESPTQYLRKPFWPAALAMKVRQLLDR